MERTQFLLQQPVLGLRFDWLKSNGNIAGELSTVLLNGIQRTLGEEWGTQYVAEKTPDLRVYMLAALLRARGLGPLVFRL